MFIIYLVILLTFITISFFIGKSVGFQKGYKAAEEQWTPDLKIEPLEEEKVSLIYGALLHEYIRICSKSNGKAYNRATDILLAFPPTHPIFSKYPHLITRHLDSIQFFNGCSITKDSNCYFLYRSSYERSGVLSYSGSMDSGYFYYSYSWDY